MANLCIGSFYFVFVFSKIQSLRTNLEWERKESSVLFPHIRIDPLLFEYTYYSDHTRLVYLIHCFKVRDWKQFVLRTQEKRKSYAHDFISLNQWCCCCMWYFMFLCVVSEPVLSTTIISALLYIFSVLLISGNLASWSFSFPEENLSSHHQSRHTHCSLYRSHSDRNTFFRYVFRSL